MVKLIFLGLLSGLFFSSTFVLNELMSLEGGHWVWSASLRYAYMILFLSILIWVTQGFRAISNLTHIFLNHWKFWIVTGCVGFGAFYALICFSADYTPGWVIAATWQVTIIASLIILMVFGRTFPKKVWLFSSIIFIGVLLINISHVDEFEYKDLILGGLPVLIAAFCYPLGNQLVWEAQNNHVSLPNINSPLLKNPFNRVWLLSIGSLPLWLVLIAIYTPPAPNRGQFINTGLVALLSGVVATSIFLYARNKAKQSSEIAGVDATQSSEVVFAMIGSLLLLDSVLPDLISLIGLGLVFCGLVLFVKFSSMR